MFSAAQESPVLYLVCFAEKGWERNGQSLPKFAEAKCKAIAIPYSFAAFGLRGLSWFMLFLLVVLANLQALPFCPSPFRGEGQNGRALLKKWASAKHLGTGLQWCDSPRGTSQTPGFKEWKHIWWKHLWIQTTCIQTYTKSFMNKCSTTSCFAQHMCLARTCSRVVSQTAWALS